MAVIRCPRCNFDTLYIDDKVLKSKRSGDLMKSEDFWDLTMNTPLHPESNSSIECRKCRRNLMPTIQELWIKGRSVIEIGEWDR